MPGIEIHVSFEQDRNMWWYCATDTANGQTVCTGYHRGSEMGAYIHAEERAAECLAAYVHVDTW